MKSKKVLMLITRLDKGGSAEVVLNLAEGLQRKGYRVSVASGRTDNPQEDYRRFTARTGIPIHVIRSLRRDVNPLNDTLALFRIMGVIWREWPDVVHTHTSKAGALGRLAAWLMLTPAVVHSPHGHIFYGYFGKFYSKLFIRVERLMARLCDRIVTLTPKGTEDHIAAGIASREKYISIHSGVDTQRFTHPDRPRKEVRAEFGIKRGEKLIGWAGRLVPIKGCRYFLEAARAIAAEHPKVRFVIVGDGKLRAELTEQADSLGIRDKVIFTGNRQDITDIMHALDVFVLSSLNEGFGRVLIEAMCAGLPVVATNVGGVPNVVDDGVTGILVPPSNSGAIAIAIGELLENRDHAKKLGRAGKKRSKLFTQDAMCKNYAALYEEITK